MNGLSRSPGDERAPPTVGQRATLACLLEVTVAKPGNVHRGADFEDLTFGDFVAAAVAIGPPMQQAATGAPLGQTVLDSVTATRQLAASNVNLGMILLLAPLATAAGIAGISLREGVRKVLDALTAADAVNVYAAIRLAQPGGLGKVAEADVASAPPDDLLQAMRLAADRDLVARQYADGFTEVFDLVVPRLQSELAAGVRLGDAVIRTYLHTMHKLPDSLIARKCGVDTARQAATIAGAVLATAAEGEESYHEALADFDFWLRSDGHRRNPGTTADLIAAALFIVLHEGNLPWPLTI